MRRFLLAFTCTAACAAFAQSSYHEVASVKQLMAIINGPISGAIGGMLKAGGPKDDAEWAKAEKDAALMAEGGQLLLLGARPKDQDVWVKTATQLSDSSAAAMKAAAAGVNGSCRGCHTLYRKR